MHHVSDSVMIQHRHCTAGQDVLQLPGHYMYNVSDRQGGVACAATQGGMACTARVVWHVQPGRVVLHVHPGRVVWYVQPARVG